MARQYSGPNDGSIQVVDIYIPIGTLMELICYIGLLKVAEDIKHPFGEKDEDFDLDFLITRHLNVCNVVSYLASIDDESWLCRLSAWDLITWMTFARH